MEAIFRNFKKKKKEKETRFKHNHIAPVIYTIKRETWRVLSISDCFESEVINVRTWVLFVCISSSQEG